VIATTIAPSESWQQPARADGVSLHNYTSIDPV